MNLFRKVSLCLVISSLFATSALAQVNMEKLRKEIRILDRVVEAAFDDNDHNDDTLEPGSIRALYLAKQGVLLDVSVGHGFPGFDFAFDNHFKFDFDFGKMDMGFHRGLPDGDELHDLMEEVYDDALDHLDDLDLDEIGELSKELRREMREIGKERSQLMKEAQEQYHAAMKRMEGEQSLSEADRQELTAKAEAFGKKMSVAAEKIKTRMEKAQAESLKQWDARMKPFMDTFLQTVCEYGASLRSLPNGEHLTVVFRGASRTSEGVSDLVYVFDKADLLACRDGQITVSQLQNKAEQYTY